MIVVAPTAYKEALGPVAASRAIATGLKSSLKKEKIELYPLSDGGDGFLECISYYLKGQRLRNVSLTVSDPYGEKLKTQALVRDKQAFLESASILGLRLLSEEERNPLKTTSRGLGEAVVELLNRGMEEVIVGLGGSSTIDGGKGALEVLGIRFLDENDKPLGEGPCEFSRLARVDTSGLDERIKRQVQILWDVDNPLLGPHGVLVYAPQKGASEDDMEKLETALSRYAEITELAIAHRLDHRRGMGAAGGIAFGFAALTGCKTMSGADFLLRLSGLRDLLKKEDVIISGEGKLDKQSLSYKVVGSLRRLPHSRLILLCGEIAVQIAPRDKRTAALSIQPGPIDKTQAMKKTKEYLKRAASQIGRLLSSGN
ncbi:glycerate kinase [candidate division WOR-3 bacterium]|uniref:Glycerate kinase n=1 Tax=candidate division WOR-3 bacterium TaxID=2052148 RepID=A0A9D5K9G1_UNCW3|nr:glycerate kinase [candidate division WOR-3 bacterium]MBD3364039.1 glycerate kinase [candidate division WOR-3 bacterium]